MDILKAETETVINSITVVGIKTPLDMAFIALQDKRESIYSKPSKPKASTIPLFNKSKKLQT